MTPIVSPGRGRPPLEPAQDAGRGFDEYAGGEGDAVREPMHHVTGRADELAVSARPREADLVVVQTELSVALLASPATIARDHSLADHSFPHLEIGHALAELATVPLDSWPGTSGRRTQRGSVRPRWSISRSVRHTPAT